MGGITSTQWKSPMKLLRLCDEIISETSKIAETQGKVESALVNVLAALKQANNSAKTDESEDPK